MPRSGPSIQPEERRLQIDKFESWICERPAGVFDASREGAAPMPWDYGVGKITTSDGIEGLATFWAARSRAVTEAYLSDVIAPAILGRNIADREKIWHDFWNIDRPGAFFPVFLPGSIDVALWDAAAKTAELPLHKFIGSYRDKLSVYASSLWLATVEEHVAEALHYKSRGFKAHKIHPCGPSDMGIEIHTTTMGPMDMANVHVSCAVRNRDFFELFVPEDVFQVPMVQKYDDFIDGNGDIHAPMGSGLGIDIDWDLVENACSSHRVF